MSTYKYRGCVIRRTSVHTTTYRRMFGRMYATPVVRPLYEVTGALQKLAGQYPLITSLAMATEYIRDYIDDTAT